MKLNYTLSTLLLSVFIVGCNNFSQDDAQALKGPYLGQKPPGSTPVRFAPGVVSTEHRDLSAFFSPDMKEFFFTRKDNTTKKWSLISYKSENGQWHKVATEPRVGRPFISPDGKTMHLGNKYKHKTEAGWSDIKSLGSPYEDIRIMRLTASLNGTYVLDEGTREGDGLLRYSRLIDGKREQPQAFIKEINTGKWNAHPFIAPDESYIMWDGERESGFGKSDIFISFKQEDGSWTEAINLGDKINTEADESSAYVTPDGKYLFFNSYHSEKNGDIYWVDAQFIETLRP